MLSIRPAWQGPLWLSLIWIGAAAAQEPNPSPYRVPPIYLPRPVRPDVAVARDSLPRGTVGMAAPAFDGDRFVVNLQTGDQPRPKDEEVAGIARRVARAAGWQRDSTELVLVRRSPLATADTGAMKREVERGLVETRRRASGKVGALSPATDSAIRATGETVLTAARAQRFLWVFEQRVDGVPIDNSGVTAQWAEGRGLSSARGRVFNQVTIANHRRLSPGDARRSGERHVKRYEAVRDQRDSTEAPVLVLVPYAKVFRYTWRLPVDGESGRYRVWVDAESGQVLQLLPEFFFDAAQGLTFMPSPAGTTEEQGFEINPADGSGNFRLQLTNIVDITNGGADGVSSGDLTASSTNFNTAPLNGTTVDRTNQAGYNSRFQDINAYAWVYHDLQWAKFLGAQPFGSLDVRVNLSNTGCSGGANQACASGNRLSFGIGTATTGTSTSSNDLFNSALDATVITHEWGHVLSRNQFGVSGGMLHGSVSEGMSDFWGSTILNTDTFGDYWNQNATAPVQTGWIPRQAEATDVFPEHRQPSNREIHADGQIIHWALWRSRMDMANRSAPGILLMNLHLVRALTTSGIGVGSAIDDQTVHDAFLDVLQELMTEIGVNTTTHSALVGFARAGLMLSERDAVIDINDPYLARTGPAPSFTVWTGRDFSFGALGTAVASSNFNTRFRIQVANDPAFSVNLVTSPQRTATVSGLVPQGSWTLPNGKWATLSKGNALYYRVTTTDNAGGNVRTSGNPGNGFMTGLPAASAAINSSGECECTCSSAGAQTTGSGDGVPRPRFPWAMLVPLGVAGILWLRRTRRA